MDPNLRTLSLAAWMSLPGLDFTEWEKSHPATNESELSCDKCKELQSEKHQMTKVSLPCNKCRLYNSNGSNINAINRQNTIASYEDNGKTSVKLYPPRRDLTLKRQISKEVETRALISRVAEYYECYVSEMGLEKYFMNDTIVTTVMPVNGKGMLEVYPEGRWVVCG